MNFNLNFNIADLAAGELDLVKTNRATPELNALTRLTVFNVAHALWVLQVMVLEKDAGKYPHVMMIHVSIVFHV